MDCKPSPAATEKLIIDSAVACRPPISATSRPWNAHDAAGQSGTSSSPIKDPLTVGLFTIEPVLTEASHPLMERLVRRPPLGILKGHERNAADSTDCQWCCTTGISRWSREVSLDHSKSREALVGGLRSAEAHGDRPSRRQSHRYSHTRPESSMIQP